MDQERNIFRFGLWVIVFAAVLRLLGSGVWKPVAAWLGKPETVSFLLYLQTGRVARSVPETPPTETEETVPSTTAPEPTLPEPTQPVLPVFAAVDTELIDMSVHCSYEPDLETLLTQPLTWDLTGTEPTVLIVHTHATESFTRSPGEDYTESSAYRTLDESYNMVSIGAYLASLLEDAGIRVLHDTGLHDHPSYTGAYNSSRASVQSYLKEYPSIRLVLDLHRDALSLDSETQLRTEATVKGQTSAQLMMVVGTDAGGLFHPDWQENLSLALKLHAQLEKDYPGITRPISFRSQRFNQDLLPGAMLVEVGAAGNTHAEALRAVEALAQAIIELSRGSS